MYLNIREICILALIQLQTLKCNQCNCIKTVWAKEAYMITVLWRHTKHRNNLWYFEACNNTFPSPAVNTGQPNRVACLEHWDHHMYICDRGHTHTRTHKHRSILKAMLLNLAACWSALLQNITLPMSGLVDNHLDWGFSFHNSSNCMLHDLCTS